MPALSPERRLQRVLHVALFDALSLIVVAAPAAVVALCTREWFVAIVCIGVALCGQLELVGRRRLQRRSVSGLGWMCAAQLCCLLFILLYAGHLSRQLQAGHILALLPSFTRDQLAELFPDPESLNGFFLGVQQLTAALLALVSIFYQGGMAFYYLRARPVARAVFAAPPVIESSPPPLPGQPPPLP
jgi:hypothetical protein